jgi:hypothetical protein
VRDYTWIGTDKLLFINEFSCNFIFQIIRNFYLELNYEMKFQNKLLRIPVSPLKFKMIDRE